ncbi:GFA family protein [Ruegeria sp. 2012CJ41-6]|uniref:GFA family protein n=1 Tax=Ruegeria spongiae TaxID=2942209 RepID=A0ABT0Q4F0_9RHOB|nr:GFA family protein [Ruegeria spongiae]MCL6284053.1 GFA family protein [Ruegeria spongiae]
MKGHCHCGDVRWESDGAVAWSCYCHCADCRRNCAAPVTAFFGVPHDSVRWSGGEPRTYHSSERVERLFCGTCGTPMAYRNDADQETVHLYVATLENPEDIAPQIHVFHSEHIPWLQIGDHLPKYASIPS